MIHTLLYSYRIKFTSPNFIFLFNIFSFCFKKNVSDQMPKIGSQRIKSTKLEIK
jgi:hypothetical protein